MMQAAPSSPTPPPQADHPSPPSRLLSKHRPRRRAAPARQTLPPPAPTRGQPDLSLCRCCGARFPPTPPGAKPRPVRPLRSVWRIVLLCSECLPLIRSAVVCSYCLSLDNLPPEDSSVICRSCKRCVHRHCIPAEHRTALIQPVDLENFVCVDCCPTLKPGSKNMGAREPTSSVRGKGEAAGVCKLNSPGKMLASKRAKEATTLIAGAEGSGSKGTSDPDLPDEKLALQLHLAMNGSQRISRSSSASWAVSAGKGKGQKVVDSARNANGDQGLCVTNMMDQLEDDLSGAEMGDNSDAEHDTLLDPSVTVVLALECKGKQAQERMRGKRKGPPGTKHNGLVDRYMKKYSKRSSSKKANVISTGIKTMPDGKDMDRDDGGKGIVPMI